MAKKMKAKDFFVQLKELKKSFLASAEKHGKIDLDTFEIHICKGYLLMRVEGEDADGDTFAVSQEIESDNDVIYQCTLFGGNIIVHN